MNNIAKSIAIWLAVAIVLMTVFKQFSGPAKSDSQIVYSQFIQEVKDGHVAAVSIEGRVLRGQTSDGKKFTTYAPYDPGLMGDLLKSNVRVEAKPEEEQSKFYLYLEDLPVRHHVACVHLIFEIC